MNVVHIKCTRFLATEILWSYSVLSQLFATLPQIAIIVPWNIKDELSGHSSCLLPVIAEVLGLFPSPLPSNVLDFAGVGLRVRAIG